VVGVVGAATSRPASPRTVARRPLAMPTVVLAVRQAGDSAGERGYGFCAGKLQARQAAQRMLKLESECRVA